MSPEANATNTFEDDQSRIAGAQQPDDLRQTVYRLLDQKYAGFKLFHGRPGEIDREPATGGGAD